MKIDGKTSLLKEIEFKAQTYLNQISFLSRELLKRNITFESNFFFVSNFLIKDGDCVINNIKDI